MCASEYVVVCGKFGGYMGQEKTNGKVWGLYVQTLGFNVHTNVFVVHLWYMCCTTSV